MFAFIPGQFVSGNKNLPPPTHQSQKNTFLQNADGLATIFHKNFKTFVKQ